MQSTPTILTITSGKGGVGKSVIAVNLAETLAAQGLRVALLDVDLGQGGCAVLLNETPTASLIDYVRQVARAEEVIYPTQGGVSLIQGASEPGQTDGRETQLYAGFDALLKRLKRSHDFILIDTPAGVDGPVRWAMDRSDFSVMVLVDEPTAVTDAYRLAKMTWRADPSYPLSMLVNYADTEAEARSVASRFGQICSHFLNVEPTYLGWLPYAREVRQSVRHQMPAVRTPGIIRNAFQRIAAALTSEDQPAFEEIELVPKAF